MADVERGVEVMGRVGEVMPEQAEGRVAEIYEDVRGTLRVPFVNYIFRATANFPEVLDGLWQELRRVARTTAFERAADGLREEASAEELSTADADEPSDGDADEPQPEALVDDDDLSRAESFTETIHYVLPKLLLVASGFAVILDGEVPTGAAPDLGPELPYGPAEGSQELGMVAPDDADERVEALYDDIQERHDHPGVASYYRALAQWPELLDALWTPLRPVVGTPSYVGRRAELTAMAGDAIRNLLTGGRTWQQLGLAPDEAREVRHLVEVFRAKLVPDLLIDVSLIRSLLGTHGPNRLRAGERQATGSPSA